MMNGIEKLFQLIKTFIPLTSLDQALIEKSLVPLNLRKGDFLLREGQFNNGIGFLSQGLMRSFYIDSAANEITSGFFQENSFCTDLNSFQNGTKSDRSIEALSDCKLLILKNAARNQLREQVKAWDEFEHQYLAKVLIEKVNYQRQISISSAAQAYQIFIDTYEQAALYAPRYQIASFLGISPFTLSRLKIGQN